MSTRRNVVDLDGRRSKGRKGADERRDPAAQAPLALVPPKPGGQSQPGSAGVSSGRPLPTRRRASAGDGSGGGRTKPNLARRVLLGIALVAVALIVAQPLSRWFTGPYLVVRMRTVPGYLGRLEAGTAAKGVLVRDETVVLSPIAGRISLLVNDGERVRLGTQILKIENRPVLEGAVPHVAQAESELKALELERVRRSDELAEQLVAAQSDIDDARADLSSTDRALALEAKRALRRGIETMRRLSAEKAALDLGSSPQRTQLLARRDEVWSAMSQSEYSYKCSMSGLVSYTTDGLEAALSLRGRREDLAVVLEDMLVESGVDETVPTTTRDADVVQPGTPVARVVNNFSAYLAALLPARRADELAGCRVRVRFDSIPDRIYRGTYYQSLPTGLDSKAIVLFALDEYVDDFTHLRMDDVEIINAQYEGIIVPKSSIVSRDDGVQGVFIAKGWYPVFQKVEVRAESRDKCAVSGVPEGARVVRNPWVIPSTLYGS